MRGRGDGTNASALLANRVVRNTQELTDDGVDTTALVYTYDAWDRLVKVEYKDASGGGVEHPRAEYEYNGLNWRTMKRADTDITDGTHALDQQRAMYYSANWQLLEERIDDDYIGDPGIDSHQQYVWGFRYIDDIIAHREDDDTDGTYDETWYHLSDAQFSTVAIIDEAADLIERVAYDAYGNARHQWKKDVDGDGDHDIADNNIVNNIYRTYGSVQIWSTNYNADADLDRDGDVDGTDAAAATGSAAALALGQISSSGAGAVENQIGWDGYVFNPEVGTYTVRSRSYTPELGRWLERDPLHYFDGHNLFLYCTGDPVTFSDPWGLMTEGSTTNGQCSELADLLLELLRVKEDWDKIQKQLDRIDETAEVLVDIIKMLRSPCDEDLQDQIFRKYGSKLINKVTQKILEAAGVSSKAFGIGFRIGAAFGKPIGAQLEKSFTDIKVGANECPACAKTLSESQHSGGEEKIGEGELYTADTASGDRVSCFARRDSDGETCSDCDGWEIFVRVDQRTGGELALNACFGWIGVCDKAEWEWVRCDCQNPNTYRGWFEGEQ